TDCSIVTLPVELIDFTVKQAGMSVQVNWKTGSELNNDYFTVEKSMNGSIWSQIAKVKGAGTTNQLNEYSALDDKPFTGISYYRIKQTDFNGDFQYTNVEKVEFKGTESILVYPQPAKDKLTLVWDGFDGDITLMDFSGQIVNVPTQKSKNGSYIADVSQLQRGIYFIKLSDGKSVITKKITIQ
ncbi:MAG: T9SS type A sorting domain-containing protein, partial [Crocinitomicaceae bacterium]